MPTELRPHYDAIVIGSGPGGSAVTLRLAQAGKRVLVIERGTELKPDAEVTEANVGRYLYDELKDGGSPSRFLGGASKFYGAALYRLRETDFQAVEHETGLSPAWPFDYQALEPYYTEAERLYHVHGDPESDPTEPPRSAPMPYGPLPHSEVMAPFVKRLEDSGTQISAIPRGLDYGPGGKCVLCPTCDAYYCQLDAKWDAETATLRPALRTGNVDVALGGECLKIVTDEAGQRATGVLVRYEGVERQIAAEHVVVAAGLPGSMTLLWQSRTDRHPAGLGNNSGNLGRYLGGHSTGIVLPLLSFFGLPPNHTKTFAINTHYNGAPDWKYPLGVIQAAGQMPYWRMASRLMRLPAWMVAKRSVMLFYMVEAVPGADSGYAVTAEGIGEKVEPKLSAQTFEKARQKVVDMVKAAGYRVIARRRAPSLWHEVGTARMGTDPATSVCNPDCEVHDIRNLYVADASVLPTAGAVNTCLTIVAVALKAGDAILSKEGRTRAHPNARPSGLRAC
jgi:choline dehydrogenase-like flavoprotein